VIGFKLNKDLEVSEHLGIRYGESTATENQYGTKALSGERENRCIATLSSSSSYIAKANEI
jgi:hypothetical protein